MIQSILLAVPLLVLAHCLQVYLRLSQIPGPFFARFTDFYRLLIVWRRDSHETYLKWHRQYGDVVRIGPNAISICKPDLIPIIYGIGKGYVKSDFYLPWQNIINGKRSPSPVFTTDESLHAAMKRPIAHAYSLSTLREFEPLIDSTTAVFLSRLDELFASTGATCDLGQWLQWFAFDVIGELTFSKRLGFLERAEDIENICASVAANFDRCSVLGQMPWLDLVTWKNPLYLRVLARPVSSPIVSFGQRRLKERRDDASEDGELRIKVPDPALEDKILHGVAPSKPDFLSRFLVLQKEQPDVVTEPQLLTYLFMNMNAGSDTISSTLRAVFYYLLKHPSTCEELVRELDLAEQNGTISVPLPTWTECQDLKYLNAVIKEAVRLNPAIALPLERIVPPGTGLQVESSTTIPPGTVVGINAWILQRDKRIFGEDAEKWNPSRWLDDDTEKVKYMDNHILTFGAGKRTCLGRHIAMLELTKLVPALVLRYRMKLAFPEREWRMCNSFVIRQEGLQVLFEKRGAASST